MRRSTSPVPFHEAAARYVGVGDSEQSQVWINYVLSTNQRGEEVVAKILEFVPTLRGRRLLDVGSGYGGVCIAAARAGGDAVGLEMDGEVRDLAEANLAEFPSLTASFRAVDAMDWAQLSTLGRFDVITCDNVIEHVTNPPALLAYVRRLLQPDGLLYLTAPNAFSLGQIVKDCHYGQFGLSLVDPLDGERWVQEILHIPSYEVLYLRLAEYESLLGRYGLHTKLLNPLSPIDDVMNRLRAARREIGDAYAAATIPSWAQPRVDRLLQMQLARFDADVAFFEALPTRGLEQHDFVRRLELEDLHELWYFVASPNANVI